MTEPESNKSQDRRIENKPAQEVFEIKGIQLRAYLLDTGEFRWIPTFNACETKENAKRILEVLKKMPEDRRKVWVQRLDIERAQITCPVIRIEAELCKEFDDLCAAYSKPVGTRPDEKNKGGESAG